jgi:hypothetical protein
LHLRVERFIESVPTRTGPTQRSKESESYDTANLHVDIVPTLVVLVSVVARKVRLARTFFRLLQ